MPASNSRLFFPPLSPIIADQVRINSWRCSFSTRVTDIASSFRDLQKSTRDLSPKKRGGHPLPQRIFWTREKVQTFWVKKTKIRVKFVQLLFSSNSVAFWIFSRVLTGWIALWVFFLGSWEDLWLMATFSPPKGPNPSAAFIYDHFHAPNWLQYCHYCPVRLSMRCMQWFPPVLFSRHFDTRWPLCHPSSFIFHPPKTSSKISHTNLNFSTFQSINQELLCSLILFFFEVFSFAWWKMSLTMTHCSWIFVHEKLDFLPYRSCLCLYGLCVFNRCRMFFFNFQRKHVAGLRHTALGRVDGVVVIYIFNVTHRRKDWVTVVCHSYFW